MAGQIALNKPSGGQLILSPEDGTSTETVTIPSVGVGKVLQVSRIADNNPTNVVVATTWVELATGNHTVTAISPNSSYIYSMSLSYESDQTGSNNMWIQLMFRVNGGAWQYPTDNVLNMCSMLDSQGTGNMNYSYVAPVTSNAGDTIEFKLRYRQYTSNSIYFNQQALGGQPTYNNYSTGYIMEVAA